MRNLVSSSSLLLLTLAVASGQDFSGTWTLKSEHAERGTLPERPAPVLEIEHRDGIVRCAGAQFSTDGKESRSKAGEKSLKTIAKWEGAALLVNTIVGGPSGAYAQMDRWTTARDGSTLTIEREVALRGGTAEAVLLYAKKGFQPRAAAVPPLAPPPKPPEPAQKPAAYTIDAGTRIPLVLLNSVSTKQSAEGDRVYLSTAFPILNDGRVVIPPGSYVAGTLTFVKRPGRVHGRGELFLRFDTLTLPTGATRDFRSRVGALDGETRGELDRREGNLKSEGGKGSDARTIGETTAAGASVGGLAGAVAHRPGLGAGVGGAAGAAAGLTAVLLTRGPDLVLPRGGTLEMILDRPLVFTEAEIDVHGWRRQ